MVLDYLQMPVSYEALVKQLRIGYAGAPFTNLRYLEGLGVSVLIAQGNVDTLRSYLNQNLPPIVFVATQELSYWDEATNHAVVVAGIDDQQIDLHDAHFADAPKRVAITEFELAWLEMDEFYAIVQLRKML
jgi:ABC-type bacteriocin/lantibiotic exporter with double-glycine peptidase domain